MVYKVSEVVLKSCVVKFMMLRGVAYIVKKKTGFENDC